jgi:hypothetical protein
MIASPWWVLPVCSNTDEAFRVDPIARGRLEGVADACALARSLSSLVAQSTDECFCGARTAPAAAGERLGHDCDHAVDVDDVLPESPRGPWHAPALG